MEKMIQYLEAHGQTVHGAAGGQIAVVSCWTLDGAYGETIELIPATWDAVRRWLGY